MNPSHAYSDAAPKPKSYVGIGLVVALHLAGIYALSAGLVGAPTRHQAPIAVKPVMDVVKPPEPVDPVKAVKPVFQEVPVVGIPVPPIVVDGESYQLPPVTTGPVTNDPGPVAFKGPTGNESAPATASKPEVRTAGAVCAVMPQPEVPALNWSGNAVLHVLATVRGGRVVGSEVQVLQGVALDGRTRRSLEHAVEAALAGYQCQGDAMFQQDFAFRID